jgi:hypothetical protein
MKKLTCLLMLLAIGASAQKGRPMREINITAGGTANAITGTVSPATWAAYADMDTTPPMVLCFEATATNTSAVTINLNSLGAKSLFKLAGAINTPLVAGDINAGQWVCAKRYVTGDAFQMITPTGNAAGGSSGLDLSSAGYCYLLNACVPYAAPGAAVISDDVNKVFMVQVLIPYTVKITTVAVYAANAGTSQFLSVGIWNNSANTPGSFVSNSTATFSNWASGALTATVNGGTGITLTPGVYWFGYATTSATVQFYTRDNAGVTDHLGLTLHTTPRWVKCSNSASGSYTLPATCGTATSKGDMAAPWILSVP